ncbi:hypothetical protein Gpo141_00002797 [Globisporangium polare]
MAVDEDYGKVVDESFTADEYGRVRINVVGVYQVNLMLMDHERVVSDDAVEIWLPGKLKDAEVSVICKSGGKKGCHMSISMLV